MKALLASFLILSIALSGCKSGDGATSPAPGPSGPGATKPSTPDEALREQLRSGQFQLAASLDSIEAALTSAKAAAKDAKGDLKVTLDDVVDRVNSTGEQLGNLQKEVPSLDDVKKSYATLDDMRLKNIDEINDALIELREALKIVDALVDGAADAKAKQLEDLGGLLDSVAEDVKGTLEAFGGKEVPLKEESAP